MTSDKKGLLIRPKFETIYMNLACALAERSTCSRLKVGCVITSSDYSRVLAIGYNGNYPGGPNCCDSDEPGKSGCFTANSLVTTNKGKKKIKNIRVGDLVLTHEGRYKPVTKLFTQPGMKRKFIKLRAGHKANPRCQFVSTDNHPILIERNGETQWVQADKALVGDFVFRTTTNCRVCERKIPDFRELCNNCFQKSSKSLASRQKASDRMKMNNPMKSLYFTTKLDNRRVESLIEKQKNSQKLLKDKLFKHVKDYNLDKKYRCVIVDHIGVRPDIILINWEDKKVIAYEYEKYKRNVNEKKYINNKQYDEIKWFVEQKPQDEWGIYKGFAKIQIKSIEELNYTQPIYNIEVEEDHSFVCQSLVVHNCTHSEINALIKCADTHTPKTIFITHAPCFMCAKAILSLPNVKLILYKYDYRDMSSVDLLNKALPYTTYQIDDYLKLVKIEYKNCLRDWS